MTREEFMRAEFMKQAESVKAGLTWEQLNAAIIKDVNTCIYLKAHNQMYPIETMVDSNVKQYAKKIINETSILKWFGKVVFSENINNIVDDDNAISMNAAPFELAYLSVCGEHKETDGAFINKVAKLLIADMKTKSVKYNIVNKTSSTEEQGAEEVLDSPEMESIGMMTREQFLLQAESLKPGLTGHKFCDALDEDIKKCIELSKQGKMYSLQELEDKNMAYIKYIEDSIVDSEECAAGAWQDIDDYDNMNKVLKNADADDAQYISSMAPVEVLYSAITRLRIDMLDVYALRLAADIMLKRVHYTIFNTHDIGSTVQNAVSLPDDSEIKYSLKFPNERNISVEEANKISKILSAHDIQEKLKELKVRKGKDGYMYEDKMDYKFDKEKYDYAFSVDTMHKGKKIIILFSVDGNKEPADIFLADEND